MRLFRGIREWAGIGWELAEMAMICLFLVVVAVGTWSLFMGWWSERFVAGFVLGVAATLIGETWLTQRAERRK